MSVEETILWASIIFLFYTYAGYPLWTRLRAAVAAPLPAYAEILPAVSVLVVVHNEERRIEEKIANLLALDYPRDRLEIVIASDASTDATVSRARAWERSGIQVVECTERRGKPAVLNELVPGLRGDVVVLMDVRQRVDSHAIRTLVRNFSDPRVGAVSGELMLQKGEEGSEVSGVDAYWRYEKFVRLNESRVDSTVGATGALYAIRRRLFRPVPPDTLIDDVLIPMQIVRQGYRVLFEPAAKAWDKVSATAEEEFRRKVRTIAGNFQLLFRHPWLLNPVTNRLWLQTLSHKFCRLLGPACLAAVFVCNLMLLEAPFYQVLLALQILFYGASIAGRRVQHMNHGAPLLSLPYAFCLLNWATVMGFSRFIRGRQEVTWKS